MQKKGTKVVFLHYVTSFHVTDMRNTRYILPYIYAMRLRIRNNNTTFAPLFRNRHKGQSIKIINLMKKIKLFFLMLTLALLGVSNANATKVFATFGTPAGQGSWNAETQTYSWTAGYSNLMPIFTFANGELTEYTALHLTTSDYVDGPYRVCFMNGGTAVATIAFYSAGEKNLVLSERNETKDLDLSQITSIQFGGASNAGSVKLDPTSVYLVKPASCNFGDDGKAHFSVNDLDVTGNVTIDYENKTVTSTGDGTISISLPNADFSNVTRIDVTRSGDDICNSMAINDAVNGNLNTWYGSKYGCDFSGYQSKAGQVNKIEWYVNTAGTMTISDIVITANVISASDARLVDVTKLPYKKWSSAGADAVVVDVAYPANECGKAMGQGSTIFGDGNVHYLNYVDLTEYSALKVKASAGAQIRICMNRLADPENKGSVTVDETKTVDSEGYATFDLTGYEFSHLIAIKFPWNGQTHTVYSIEAVNDNAKTSYIITGSGMMTSSAQAALADANAKVIDAKGVTGTGVTLTSANPNCIFLANAGALANEENVCVDGTINKLAIYDGKPFALPAEATSATAASYDRVFSAAYSTVCLPFAATVTGKAYEYKAEEAEKVTFKEVEGNTLEAGKAYLVEADFAVTGGAGTLATTPADDAFKGTFEKLTISSDATKSYYGFSNGAFVKVGSNVTVNPFRAYLTSTSSAAKLNVIFGGATGINKIDSESKNNAIKAIYGVDGAQKSKLTKGINVLKLQNGETVKVNIK